MATLRTTLTLDAQLHERWSALRAHVSLLLRHTENSLGLQPMLGLLIDHWEQSPPVIGWLEAQAQLYPKRGRPRRSEPASMAPRVALRATELKGHELISRKKDVGSAYRIFYCKHCSMMWSTWDFKEPPAQCVRVAGFSAIYTPKIWKKKDLLLEGFELDEVAWADE